MKKVCFLLLILSMTLGGLSNAVFGQTSTYGNEWINFNQSYFRVRIATEGLYKVSTQELSNMGFGNVPGDDFALFRDGKEVPIYTTTSGVFGPSDYILFYAHPSDGQTNTELYNSPTNQPDIELNLFTDSAAYYLTHGTGNHQRIVLVNNPIPTPTPTAAPYCLRTVSATQPARTSYYAGKSYDNATSYFYSSKFDFGEGYSLNTAAQNNVQYSFPTTEVYTGADRPDPILSFNITSGTNQSDLPHTLSVTYSTYHFLDTTFYGYNYIKKEIPFTPSPALRNPTSQVRFTDNQRMRIFYARIKYARTFNFNGTFADGSDFALPQNERYIEIQNLNQGSTPSLFYDISSKKLYQATVDGTSSKWYLDATVGERACFVSTENGIHNLTGFQPIVFKDYTSSQVQGNYIILSHKDYINATPNYLQQYSSYRSSNQGGNYTPTIIDVTELYDQFGYGYWGDPLSVKRFLNFAINKWQIKPEYLFIVGKGVFYSNYRTYLANRPTYPFAMVPTWGHPGSDNLLSVNDQNPNTPQLSTGRLSAYNNQEIGDYLNKVQAYEGAIATPQIPTVENDYWKKQALHIAGGSDLSLQSHLLSSLNTCANIYQDTLTGGTVTTISKNNTDPVADIDDPVVDSMINNGVQIISFYGHASSSGFDYNLNDPHVYHSNPRFPVFFAFGCDVAQVYQLTNEKTISEEYVHSDDGGSIVMIADDNLGYTGTLPTYMRELYKEISFRNYGQTLGKQFRDNVEKLLISNSSDFMQIHTQCIFYQGDPAIKVYSPGLPDYVVEESGLSATPSNVSTTIDSFEIQAKLFNLGKALDDTVMVTIEHTHPGNNNALFADTILLPKLYLTDTISFKIPIDPLNDIGLNNYKVTIDANHKYDELSEQNNSATLQIFIFANSLQPIYPARFSIVHEQGVTLKASTLNAFAPLGKYKFQIDTTALFNSPQLQSTEIESIGGVLTWKPNLTLQDSTVYYWRTASDSVVNGQLNWNQSSFIYLAQGSDGWNQSHFYQFQNDEMSKVLLPESTRTFAFEPISNHLTLQNQYIVNENDYPHMFQSLNSVILQTWGCFFAGSVQIMVIDSVTGQPWFNDGNKVYGDLGKCNTTHNNYSFQFNTTTFAGRDSAIAMINRVPQGNYIMISNVEYNPQWAGSTIDSWKADTAVLGSGHSLYHSIKDLGFPQIDEFTGKKPFIFFRKKGDNSYPVYQVVGQDSSEIIRLDMDFLSFPDSGSLRSTIIGPAAEWQQLIWNMDPSVPNFSNDNNWVTLFGINPQGQETKLFSGKTTDTTLSFINAQVYPSIRLVWHTSDTTTRTSGNLNYWRVLYKPVPEAALSAVSGLEFIDSLTQGQQGKLRLTIQNVTPYDMDSMLVKYRIIDANNTGHDLTNVRYRKLPGNDSLMAYLEFNADQYPGKNFLYIEANPNNDQPEQYHPNNIGYLPFSMTADKTNPLLDVTFDGIHILDKDIVSAKPFIKIVLRDENQFSRLSDTSTMQVQLLRPSSTRPETIPFDGQTCQFLPSDGTGDNQARVEYRPNLMVDGVYKLMVKGKDNAGNLAENNASYEVQFTVENKSTITNVLNYPNPFSTATQFVFTMTGSRIPSQFKIQILSVTGKVVREITRDELGPLHIGRNITDYRWDGRDQNGNLLGNGVYLYHVVTSIDGESVEHRTNQSIDQYFKKGYGKLYIMR